MKNADMPAMANDLDVDTACGMIVFEGSLTVEKLGKWRTGLTKREHFAAMAMQGLLASGVMSDYDEISLSASYMAMDAVSAADALLAELEEKS